MTRGHEQGKKIDEIRLDWDSCLTVRYHSHPRNPTFTVEGGDGSFTGTNLSLLIEQATVHVKGWSELKWEKVILLETEIYSEIKISYSRCFKAKFKGKDVFRQWRVGDENEGSLGGFRDDKNKTADRFDGAEPGEVMHRRGSGRILPYTNDRWAQIRELSKKLNEMMDKTAEKLSELLKEKDIDPFLEGSSGLKTLGIQYKEKA